MSIIRFQQYMIMMHILRSIAVPRLCKWIINADKFKKDFKKCHDHARQIDGRFLVLVNKRSKCHAYSDIRHLLWWYAPNVCYFGMGKLKEKEPSKSPLLILYVYYISVTCKVKWEDWSLEMESFFLWSLVVVDHVEVNESKNSLNLYYRLYFYPI